MTSLIGNAPVDGVDVAALLGIPISAEQELAVQAPLKPCAVIA